MFHFPVLSVWKLYYVDAPKPGTHTWFPEQLSAKWHLRTIPWGLKWTPMAPRERQFAPPMSQDACVRVNNSHFYHTKNTVKKIKYGHWSGCNLLPTDADGIISPDILCMVHTTKDMSIYSNQFLPQLHIIRFQKGTGSAISRYWAYEAVLCSSAQTLILDSQSSSPQNDIAELSHGV